MKFYSRKLIKPGDLNANNTLFGGQLLKWIDEEEKAVPHGKTLADLIPLVPQGEP